MAKQKLPHAKEYDKRPIENWNVVTYRAYMNHLCETRFGVSLAKSKLGIVVENKQIKDLYEKHGRELLRDVITTAFKNYKPTPQYPAPNWHFLNQYVLPKLIQQEQAKAFKQKQSQKRQGEKLNTDELLDLL